MQPFDPTSTYPGNVETSGRRHQLNVAVFFTENDVSIHVVTAAEPSAIMMLLIAFGGLLLFPRIFGRVKLGLSFGNFQRSALSFRAIGGDPERDVGRFDA